MKQSINTAPLLANFRRYVTLTLDEEQIILTNVTHRIFRKGEFIGAVDDVDRYTNFIVSGSARVFYVDDSEQEHNIQLGIHNWWLSDYAFFTTGTPGILYVEALGKTEVLSLTYEHLQGLFANVPKLERFFRLLVEKAYSSFQQRVLSNLCDDAEKRYLEFRKRYPDMDMLISQKHIASYLGMSPEFLSKIKKRVMQKEKALNRNL